MITRALMITGALVALALLPVPFFFEASATALALAIEVCFSASIVYALFFVFLSSFTLKI